LEIGGIVAAVIPIAFGGLNAPVGEHPYLL
jgi:hypothetical protein